MDLTAFPQSLSTQTNQETVQWHLQEHLVAHFGTSGPETSEFTIIELKTVEPTDISDDKHPHEAKQEYFPVYKSDNGAVAVPSGLIYIRVSANISVESMTQQLLDRGFQINKTSLIPHVGWLQSIDSDFAIALSNLASTADLPDIDILEPQLLMQKQTR